MTITEQLDTALSEMKLYHDQMEKAADIEKKKKIDQNFKDNISVLYMHLNKIRQAKTQLKFTLTDDVMKDIEETISALESCVGNGMLDDEKLSKTNYTIKNIDKSLDTEWTSYFEKKKREEVGKLDFILQLTDEKQKFKKIKERISTVDKWSTLHLSSGKSTSKLDAFSQGIQDTEKEMNSLNLNSEITQFLTKVTNEKATVNDLNDQVIQWIKDQKLEKTFGIRFSGN